MPSILRATNVFLAVNSATTAQFVGKSTEGGEDRPKSAVQRKKKQNKTKKKLWVLIFS